MSPARRKHAEIAISSAISTLRVVLDEPDIQRSLVGIPLYLHSMITFAAVFLLKIAVKGHPGELPSSRNRQNSIALADLHIDIPLVRELVEDIVGLTLFISEQANERHVSHHIARGVGKMLDGFRLWETKPTKPIAKTSKMAATVIIVILSQFSLWLTRYIAPKSSSTPFCRAEQWIYLVPGTRKGQNWPLRRLVGSNDG
jgi:hypothetical protein